MSDVYPRPILNYVTTDIPPKMRKPLGFARNVGKCPVWHILCKVDIFLRIQSSQSRYSVVHIQRPHTTLFSSAMTVLMHALLSIPYVQAFLHYHRQFAAHWNLACFSNETGLLSAVSQAGFATCIHFAFFFSSSPPVLANAGSTCNSHIYPLSEVLKYNLIFGHQFSQKMHTENWGPWLSIIFMRLSLS